MKLAKHRLFVKTDSLLKIQNVVNLLFFKNVEVSCSLRRTNSFIFMNNIYIYEIILILFCVYRNVSQQYCNIE